MRVVEAGLVAQSAGGYASRARAELAHGVGAAPDRAATIEAAARRAYQRFLSLNQELIRVCHDWQVRPGGMPNDHRTRTTTGRYSTASSRSTTASRRSSRAGPTTSTGSATTGHGCGTRASESNEGETNGSPRRASTRTTPCGCSCTKTCCSRSASTVRRRRVRVASLAPASGRAASLRRRRSAATRRPEPRAPPAIATTAAVTTTGANEGHARAPQAHHGRGQLQHEPTERDRGAPPGGYRSRIASYGHHKLTIGISTLNAPSVHARTAGHRCRSANLPAWKSHAMKSAMNAPHRHQERKRKNVERDDRDGEFVAGSRCVHRVPDPASRTRTRCRRRAGPRRTQPSPNGTTARCVASTPRGLRARARSPLGRTPRSRSRAAPTGFRPTSANAIPPASGSGNQPGGGSAVTRRVMRLRAGPGLPDQTAEQSADEREDDEDPELAERPPVLEHRGGDAAGRVHRRVVDRDRDEVDHREHEADGDAGEAGRHRLPARARDHEHEQPGEHDLGEDHRRAA